VLAKTPVEVLQPYSDDNQLKQRGIRLLCDDDRCCDIAGFQSILKDWGLEFECILYTDSAAAKSIVSRRGAGKLRHIDTISVLATSRSYKLDIHKCKGTTNEADLGTQTLEGVVITRILGQLHVEVHVAQHRRALKAAA